jgi:hypothetical protein
LLCSVPNSLYTYEHVFVNDYQLVTIAKSVSILDKINMKYLVDTRRVMFKAISCNLFINILVVKYFVFQVNMKYNIYTEDQIVPAFWVKVNTFSRRQARNCAVKTVEVCARFVTFMKNIWHLKYVNKTITVSRKVLLRARRNEKEKPATNL